MYNLIGISNIRLINLIVIDYTKIYYFCIFKFITQNIPL